jgi:pimeloyl-ACP methyl ester carboxylesterase
MDPAQALQEFLRPPPRLRNLKREEAILAQAEASRILIDPGTENEQEEIAVYRWGNEGRRILLVHGWGGKAAQFFAFVEALRNHGFSVIAFDAPAHGSSSGGFASGPAFARAARMVADRHGPVYALVAHSLGAAGSAIALARGLKIDRAVLLAPVAYIEPSLEIFIRLHALPDSLAAGLRQKFAERYSAEIIAVPILAKAFQLPILILHDPEDGDIPFSHGEAIYAACSGAQLVPARGAGHWRILRDQGVIERALAFLG